MTSPTDLGVLRNVSIFAKLTDEELESLYELLEVREVPVKTRIVEEGVAIDHFHIVFDGIVHVRRLAQKKELLLGRLGPGGFFGEINLFDPGVATASIYAMKATQLGVIDYTSFRKWMEDNPATGYKIVSSMMTEMSRRLRQTSARLVHSVYWSSGGIPAGPSAGEEGGN